MAHSLESASLDGLLKRYGASDHAAFAEFYRRTKVIVYGFLRRRMRNEADVDDAFQETYFRVHRYVATYDQKRSGLFWVLAIARNVVNDRFKAKVSHELSNDSAVEAAVSPDTADCQANFEDLLQSTCLHLSREDQSLLVERVFLGLSFDEISDKTQLSAAGTRQRFSRVIRRLRSMYSVEGLKL